LKAGIPSPPEGMEAKDVWCRPRRVGAVVFFDTTVPNPGTVSSEVVPMNPLSNPICSRPAQEALHEGFLALLPRISHHARVCFRHLKCHQKDDALAEVIALAWKWYVRLQEQGKHAAEFPSVLAVFAVRRVRAGRRLCGKERSKDVLTPLAQVRHSFTVAPLPSGSRLGDNVFDQALQDNMQTPVPEQVCFRCDFPRWQGTRSDRDRRLIDDLMIGGRTSQVASKHGLSPSRVAQLRREFHEDWERFCG